MRSSAIAFSEIMKRSSSFGTCRGSCSAKRSCPGTGSGSPHFDRIDLATELYNKEIFDGSDYSRLLRKRTRPYVILNATVDARTKADQK